MVLYVGFSKIAIFSRRRSSFQDSRHNPIVTTLFKPTVELDFGFPLGIFSLINKKYNVTFDYQTSLFTHNPMTQVAHSPS